MQPETRRMEPPRTGWGQTQRPEVRAEEEEESAGRKDQEREFQQVQPETQEGEPVPTRENREEGQGVIAEEEKENGRREAKVQEAWGKPDRRPEPRKHPGQQKPEGETLALRAIDERGHDTCFPETRYASLHL